MDHVDPLGVLSEVPLGEKAFSRYGYFPSHILKDAKLQLLPLKKGKERLLSIGGVFGIIGTVFNVF